MRAKPPWALPNSTPAPELAAGARQYKNLAAGGAHVTAGLAGQAVTVTVARATRGECLTTVVVGLSRDVADLEPAVVGAEQGYFVP